MANKINVYFPSPSSISLQVKLEGDWQRVESAIGKIGKDIQYGYDIAVNQYAKRLLRIVRRCILSGTPPQNSGVRWQPLSPETIKRYGEHPLLHLTGAYANSIGFFQYGSRIYVGLPLRVGRSSSGGIIINQLAIILEYGNSKIPARPLWAPAYQSIGGSDGLRREIIKEIRRKLGSSFGITPNQVKW